VALLFSSSSIMSAWGMDSALLAKAAQPGVGGLHQAQELYRADPSSMYEGPMG
jgi:hypothetical protein